MAPVACFPALSTGCLFSRAWHRLLAFPRLASVACFPALGTGCLFSRAWHRLLVFPRLTPVVCFPALSTGCLFSRTWHRLLVFPRLAPVACFPALGTGCLFSRAWTVACFPALDWLNVSCAWQRLHAFPRLAPVACFRTLDPSVRDEFLAPPEYYVNKIVSCSWLLLGTPGGVFTESLGKRAGKILREAGRAGRVWVSRSSSPSPALALVTSAIRLQKSEKITMLWTANRKIPIIGPGLTFVQ